MDAPNADNFNYERQHPPLYFCAPNKYESVIWNDSVQKSGKEFYKLLKQDDISSNNLMSNGMTVGEYCMWVLTTNHSKRTRFTKNSFN